MGFYVATNLLKFWRNLLFMGIVLQWWGVVQLKQVGQGLKFSCHLKAGVYLAKF